jgi:hypothetical protein
VELRWSWEGDVWRNVNVEVLGHGWPLDLRFLGSVWRDAPEQVGVEREFKFLPMDTVRFENLQEMEQGFERTFGVAFDNVLRSSLVLPATNLSAPAD